MGLPAKFVGRWVADGNVMQTGYPGSSFSFCVTGATAITMQISNANRIAYRLDDDDYQVLPTLSSGTVRIQGLSRDTHHIKVVICTSLKTWTGTNCARVSDISVDAGHIYAPKSSKRKILVFGDSITEGCAADDSSISAPDRAWWNVLSDNLSLDITPVGIGGIGYENTSNGDYPSVSAIPSYIENINENTVVDDTNFDIVLLELGVNDWKSKTEIDSDYVSKVSDTLARIKSKYQKADIHALLPFNQNGWPSLKQAYQNSGVHIIDTDWYDTITFSDSLHPNQVGGRTIMTNLVNYLVNFYGSSYFEEDIMKRIDTIYLDKNGIVQKVSGASANTPLEPTVPSDGIKVSEVTVTSDSTNGELSDERSLAPSYAPDYTKKTDGFYLGVFFTRTKSENNGADRVANFFVSKNGVDWKHFNKAVALGKGGEYPFWGGDPSLIYYKEKFYVAVSQNDRKTDFLIYTSTDFKHWQGKRINLGLTEDNKMVWAPDFFVSKDGELYVCLAYYETESICDIFIAHCTNIDSLTFTNPVRIKLWDGVDTTKLSTDRKHIDATVYYNNGYYYMAVKNEVKARVEIFKSSEIYSGWEKINTSVFNDNVEGPSIINIHGKWHIWMDEFATSSTGLQSAYLHAESNDLINFNNWDVLTYDDETYEHNIRHGSVIYIDSKSRAQEVIRGINDFELPESKQKYCSMNGATAIETAKGAMIDLAGSYKENNYYVINNLVLYPHRYYRVTRPLIIKNITNPLNIDEVKFYFKNSGLFLKIEAIEGNGCNYVSTGSRIGNFAMKLEGKNGSRLVRTDYNPVYIMSIGNTDTTAKYIHLFDMSAENWCGSDVIIYLENTAAYSHNAIYHIRCQKFNGELTIHGELLKSITVNHIKLFAVKNGDKFSVYAEHVSQSFIHKMTFLSKGEMIAFTYVNVATPHTYLNSLDASAVEIVS